MLKEYKIFDCNILYLPEEITVENKSLPPQNISEIPFSIGDIIRISNSEIENKKELYGIDKDCLIIAVKGSFDVIVEDKKNKKTVHLSNNRLGLYLRQGI